MLTTCDRLFASLVPVALRLAWIIFAIPGRIVADRLNCKHIVLDMDLLGVLAFAIVVATSWAVTPLASPPQSGLHRSDLVTAVVAAAFLVSPALSTPLIGAHDWR